MAQLRLRRFDSNFQDLGFYIGNGSASELKAVCDALDECVGFTPFGWFKRALRHPDEWRQ